MIFIYIPNVQTTLVSQPAQNQAPGGSQGPTGTDNNGDGVPDDIKPTTPPQQ
jgi:hypothetical protein